MGKHLVTRKSFSDEDIAKALLVGGGNKTHAAQHLTNMGRGVVSRELLRHWLKQDKKNCRTSMSETTGEQAGCATKAAGTGTRPVEDGPRVLSNPGPTDRPHRSDRRNPTGMTGDGHRVIAIDLPGLGDTTGLLPAYDKRTLATYVHRLLKKTGAENRLALLRVFAAQAAPAA